MTTLQPTKDDLSKFLSNLKEKLNNIINNLKRSKYKSREKRTDVIHKKFISAIKNNLKSLLSLFCSKGQQKRHRKKIDYILERYKEWFHKGFIPLFANEIEQTEELFKKFIQLACPKLKVIQILKEEYNDEEEAKSFENETGITSNLKNPALKLVLSKFLKSDLNLNKKGKKLIEKLATKMVKISR